MTHPTCVQTPVTFPQITCICAHMLAHTRVQTCSCLSPPGQTPRSHTQGLVLVGRLALGLCPSTLSCPPRWPAPAWRLGEALTRRTLSAGARLARQQMPAATAVTHFHSRSLAIPGSQNLASSLDTPISATLAHHSLRRSKGMTLPQTPGALG